MRGGHCWGFFPVTRLAPPFEMAAHFRVVGLNPHNTFLVQARQLAMFTQISTVGLGAGAGLGAGGLGRIGPGGVITGLAATGLTGAAGFATGFVTGALTGGFGPTFARGSKSLFCIGRAWADNTVLNAAMNKTVKPFIMEMGNGVVGC